MTAAAEMPSGPNTHYFEVQKGTKLFDVVDQYDKETRAFVRYAEELVAKYGADSATLETDEDGLHIRGLNFGFDKAPLSWGMGCFDGYFRPYPNDPEAEQFNKTLPYLENRLWDISADISASGKLGSKIIVATFSDGNGNAPALPNASRLTPFQLEVLEVGASKKEIAEIKRLGLPYWGRSPFTEKVFQASDEVTKLNHERTDSCCFYCGSSAIGVLNKHSPQRRKIRMFLRNLLAHVEKSLSP